MAYFDIESLPIFNLDSPSSSRVTVENIWEHFVVPFGQTAKVIDVGGTELGFMHKLSADKRCHVCAVNTTQTKKIRYRHLAEVPNSEGPFALGMMFGVLMHMKRVEAELSIRRIYELLLPGGSIIVAGPGHESPLEKVDYIFKRLLRRAIQKYTPQDLQEMLDMAGFVNIRTTADLTPPKQFFRLYLSRPYIVMVGERPAGQLGCDQPAMASG